MDQKFIAKGCLGLTTLSIAGFSFAVLCVGFSKILEGGPQLGVNIGVFCFILVITAFFSYATYAIFKKKTVVVDLQDLERTALSFAHHKEGYVSVADFSLQANISIDDAGAILDDLVLKNVARVEVSGSGKLVYVFDAFIGVDKTKRDTLEIAIENARNATANLKKKRAEEEALVEQHVDVHVEY